MSNIDTMLNLKTWAVVGATDNKEKFGYKIFKVMLEAGFEVYPINTGVAEILGQKCYPTLKDLPIKPEAVDIVVPPKIGEKIMHECAEIGIKNVWLQPGADTPQVIRVAEELGLNVIHHACVMVEMRRKEA
ncbi:CoA-binding protein [Pelosinus baikalensis]|uniref:CoA-binding protein n=1 Tax=Pelosinus baikalensis TaxID=2892015 RepID=A0ABS8HRX3_9FIRM|nr:CoA-binding protein [Pelosinus baikalensis]MCC5464993.1 CoA-binding protein [Pelosinus baikalensis]